MEVKAQGNYLRISPYKARQVVDLVRGKNLEEAQALLRFSPKKAARFVLKVLNSAAANAENNYHLKKDSLYVVKAFVNEGPTLKRFRARAMGRAARIRKRTSHIVIVLEEAQ